jgi:hypothetical protein
VIGEAEVGVVTRHICNLPSGLVYSMLGINAMYKMTPIENKTEEVRTIICDIAKRE